MQYQQYLKSFQLAAGKLNPALLRQKQIKLATGEVLESVFLKLYKLHWANAATDPLNARSRIFFSTWVNDASIAEQKLMYNIHALKLRELKGYKIQSRQFAELFRKKFEPFKNKWENVSTGFGPLTLMEGWVPLQADTLTEQLVKLANTFIDQHFLIDDTLSQFR